MRSLLFILVAFLLLWGNRRVFQYRHGWRYGVVAREKMTLPLQPAASLIDQDIEGVSMLKEPRAFKSELLPPWQPALATLEAQVARKGGLLLNEKEARWKMENEVSAVNMQKRFLKQKKNLDKQGKAAQQEFFQGWKRKLYREIEEIKDRYEAELYPLQLKLNVINLTPDEKKRVKARIALLEKKKVKEVQNLIRKREREREQVLGFQIFLTQLQQGWMGKLYEKEQREKGKKIKNKLLLEWKRDQEKTMASVKKKLGNLKGFSYKPDQVEYKIAYSPQAHLKQLQAKKLLWKQRTKDYDKMLVESFSKANALSVVFSMALYTNHGIDVSKVYRSFWDAK